MNNIKISLIKSIFIISLIGLIPACGGGKPSEPSLLAPDVEFGDPVPYAPSNASSDFPDPVTPMALYSQLDSDDFEDKKKEFETGEYRDNLKLIKASAAYARGATGAGETVVVVDTGLFNGHKEFQDKNVYIDAPLSNSEDFKAPNTPSIGLAAHGTEVASIAVGVRNGDVQGMLGVAYEANLHFIYGSRADTGRDHGSPGHYRPVNIELESDGQHTGFLGYAIGHPEVKSFIINYSVGISGGVERYDLNKVRTQFPNTAAALAQASVPDADKQIIVWAAGNAGNERLFSDNTEAKADSPELLPGLGVAFPELRSHVLAVVSVDIHNGRTISDFSNQCGLAKSFCLAAPGGDILTAFPDESGSAYSIVGGTSFAAPVVSGGLAVMRHFFRNTDNSYSMGNTELVARMLATANKEGIYANSDIYGAGLLDLEAATEPFGDMMAGMLGSSNHQSLSSSSISLSGTAFGSSLQRQFVSIPMVGFDSLDTAFAYPAASLITPAKQSRSRLKHSHNANENLAKSNLNDTELSVGWEQDGSITNGRLNFSSNPNNINPNLNKWWVSYGQHSGQSLGVYADPLAKEQNNFNFNNQLAFADPYLSLVRDGPGFGWSHDSFTGKRLSFVLAQGTPWFDDQQRSQNKGERGIGGLVEYRLQNGLALQAGGVQEAEGFLGARVKGALGDAQAVTTFFGGSGNWKLRNQNDDKSWQLLASAYFGHTRPELQSVGLIRDTSNILSSAFSVGVARSSIWQLDDWFGFGISQPLRAETGTANIRVPVGRNKHKEVSYQHHELDLTPEGRNLQTEMIYRMPFAKGAIRSSFGVERHSNHNPDNDIQPFMKLSFERKF